MASRSRVFHPLLVLIFSLIGALLYAACATWRFSGATLSNQYLYVVPIVVPFTAFLLDRAEQGSRAGALGLAIDTLVVVTAMMRVFGDVPYVSGHALFLTYAVLRPGSLVTRVTAALVMLEVVYLKFFVWHDRITPLTGMALALVAALTLRRFGNNRVVEQKSEPAVS